jgi:hypothetical protein
LLLLFLRLKFFAALKEGNCMEETYKAHKITASTWQLSDSGHWEPRVFVSWSEGQNGKEKPLVFTRAFSSQQEAELEGLKMAKKWIDDGKPEQKVGPT